MSCRKQFLLLGSRYVLLLTYACWQPGVTTDEIDKAAHEAIIDSGAYPSLLGFGGFPKSVSTSINECICNGIPNSRALKVRFLCQYGCAWIAFGYNVFALLFRRMFYDVLSRMLALRTT
jgi:hypothetical protein